MKILKIVLCLFLCLSIIGLLSVLFRGNDNDSLPPEETTSYDQTDCESNTEGETKFPEYTFDDQMFANSKFLVFGDSIAAGSGLESRKHSFPNRAGTLLNVEYVSNNAVGGSTLALDPNNEKRRCIANDVVDFASKSSVAYDIIIIAGGVNDKSNNLPIGDIDDFTTETVYGSLNIIVQTVQDKWPDAFFFLATPLKCRSYNNVNNAGYVLSDVADAIKAIGEKYDVPVLDLYSTSGFETASNGMNHPDCDGCHPLQGFIDEYLAPQVASFISENYKDQ